MSKEEVKKHYAEGIKAIVRDRVQNGESQREVSRELGISRYAIQSWCGLRKEVMLRQAAPLLKGRPRKDGQPQHQSQEIEIKRLRMENELLRDFLRAAGRK